MLPQNRGSSISRSEFEQMHTLYLELKEQYPDIDTLSMGMSQDYKLAVKHGFEYSSNWTRNF